MIEYFVHLGTDIFHVKDISMDILVFSSITYYDGDNTLSPS